MRLRETIPRVLSFSFRLSLSLSLSLSLLSALLDRPFDTNFALRREEHDTLGMIRKGARGRYKSKLGATPLQRRAAPRRIARSRTPVAVAPWRAWPRCVPGL